MGSVASSTHDLDMERGIRRCPCIMKAPNPIRSSDWLSALIHLNGDSQSSRPGTILFLAVQ
jgi:hypothetical protein